jgi:hypothetical protein
MKEIRNIGIIGYEGANSWAPLMAEAFNKLKYEVTHFSISRIRDAMDPLTKDDYLQWKRPFSIKSAIHGYEDRLDILFVEQSFIHFMNDIEIPVVYHHTELTTPLTVRHPDYLSMKIPEMENFIHSYHPWEYHQIRYHYYHFPQAYPPHYANDFPKDIPISYIGAPADMFDRKRDWVWNLMCQPMWNIEEHIKLWANPKVYVYDDQDDEPATHAVYNEMMARSQFVVLTAHMGVYIGRRHMEALACKTIPIIWTENGEAKRWLNQLGFIEEGKEQNCYFFSDTAQLKALIETVEYDAEIAERGYKMLTEHHTPGHRALMIERILELTMNRLYIKKRSEVEYEKSPVIYKTKSLVR